MTENYDPVQVASDEASFEAWQAEQRELHHDEADAPEAIGGADAIKALLELLCEGQVREGVDCVIGRKVLALAVLLGVGPYAGRSLEEVAKLARCTKALLSFNCVKISEKLGVHFRTQKRESARASYRASTTRAWREGRMKGTRGSSRKGAGRPRKG